MKTKTNVLKCAAVACLLGGIVLTFQWDTDPPSQRESATPSLGDSRSLRAVYAWWKATYIHNRGDRKLTLGLSYSKGLSAQFAKAHGQATLDLGDGSLSVGVSGLSDREPFDVWLVDNRPGPGRSVKPEPGDVMVRVGSLKQDGGTARLQARLEREAMRGFEIDLVVVARSGEAPGPAGLLFGSPSLFQRLYYGEQHEQISRLAEAPSPPESAVLSLLAAPFRILVPRLAFADEIGGTTDLAALVAEGERVFFEETFGGNGRTCGTCHPAENNLALDPAFIATLPPTDPLFVAEFNPALSKHFENPTLMRKFGLIQENLDGFDDVKTKFVMRGVPHILAMSSSITPAPPLPGLGPDPVDGTTIPPLQRTGWSGDGAPGGGTLREFVTGAVIQHFTKTLNRVPGIDFRLPTDRELDAMEAFQLSVGRQADLELSTLVLKGDAERGRQLFLDPNKGKCNICHDNAGASIPVAPGLAVNFNFDTGVENLPHPARTVEPFPRDGGFGRTPDGQGGFGNGSFSVPPLVEAADTGPFFHNNAVQTIEEAVDFYNSDGFKTSPSANVPPFITGGIKLEAEQVQDIAAFLRVINAMENIRSSITLLERAQDARRLPKERNPLRLSIAEINDAIKVLRERRLHPSAVAYLRTARYLVEIASIIPLRQIRNFYIGLAIQQEKVARGQMVQG
jgi:cytochrome c553